jgi:hypothetical protein
MELDGKAEWTEASDLVEVHRRDAASGDWQRVKVPATVLIGESGTIDPTARAAAANASMDAGLATQQAISTAATLHSHTTASDPHGDRAYVSGLLASKVEVASLGNLATRSATVSTAAATGIPAPGAIWFQYAP